MGPNGELDLGLEGFRLESAVQQQLPVKHQWVPTHLDGLVPAVGSPQGAIRADKERAA